MFISLLRRRQLLNFMETGPNGRDRGPNSKILMTKGGNATGNRSMETNRGTLPFYRVGENRITCPCPSPGRILGGKTLVARASMEQQRIRVCS